MSSDPVDLIATVNSNVAALVDARNTLIATRDEVVQTIASLNETLEALDNALGGSSTVEVQSTVSESKIRTRRPRKTKVEDEPVVEAVEEVKVPEIEDTEAAEIEAFNTAMSIALQAEEEAGDDTEVELEIALRIADDIDDIPF